MSDRSMEYVSSSVWSSLLPGDLMVLQTDQCGLSVCLSVCL